MNLVVDIGNTYTKLAVFKEGKIVFKNNYQAVDMPAVDKLLSEYAIGSAIISSVKPGKEEWALQLAEKISLKYFSVDMARGIVSHYLTPATLGTDRLAAVAGAKYLYPGKASLVISGGTCITYDSIDAGGNYFGGSISPGLKMRYKALHDFTAGLPLVIADAGFEGSYGSNTLGAIQSGVQNGIRYELEGFIKSYKAAGTELNILLTGGDGIFFDTLLKNSIFAPCIKIEPDLVLEGLHAAIHDNND